MDAEFDWWRIVAEEAVVELEADQVDEEVVGRVPAHQAVVPDLARIGALDPGPAQSLAVVQSPAIGHVPSPNRLPRTRDPVRGQSECF